jgi:CrcB protein
VFGENGDMRSYLLVASGGALGALARWGVNGLFDRPAGSFPFGTLLVNVVGCALIGVAARHVVRGSDRWLTITTGVLGGLTTYSAFANETRGLLDAGHPAQALLYVAVSVVAGLAAVEIARGDWMRR